MLSFMIYAPLPFPVLILCIVLFCLYLTNNKTRKRPRHKYTPHSVKNDYTIVNDVLKSYVGYPSESADASVLNPVLAEFTLSKPLGTPVSFIIKDSLLFLVIERKHICSVLFSSGSNVHNIVEKGIPYHAFITDRDASASGFMDFFTVTVFYDL